MACRQEGVPRTFKEIEAVSTFSKKEIGRCFKLIQKAHEISVDIINADDFIARFCSTLDLDMEIQNAATHIAKKSVDLDIVSGRTPISVAAASIYMASQASDDRKTQREIADIATISDKTLGHTYKLMLPMASELFPTDFKFITAIANFPDFKFTTAIENFPQGTSQLGNENKEMFYFMML